MPYNMVGSKMLILFLTFIVMNSIAISSAGETTKQNEVIESTMFTQVIHRIGEFFYGPEIEGARTFFRIKKLQASLLPVMFKMGVMATVIKIILLLSLKSVLIGKLLLFLNIGFIIAKFVEWKTKESHHGWHQQPQWSGSWQTQSIYPPPQPIHVHIHSISQEPHQSPHYEQPHYSSRVNEPYLPPVSGPYDRLDIGPVSKSNSYVVQDTVQSAAQNTAQYTAQYPAQNTAQYTAQYPTQNTAQYTAQYPAQNTAQYSG